MSDVNTGESSEMQMLRKIDAGVDELKDQMAKVEKRAIKYGAAAGAGAGAIAGGIVAVGVSFARAKLGI